MDCCLRHFLFFRENGLGELGPGQRGFFYSPAPPPYVFNLPLRFQLFHSNLGVVSDHPEVRNCPFDQGNTGELVLLAIGEISARENLASSGAVLSLRVEREIKEADFHRTLF